MDAVFLSASRTECIRTASALSTKGLSALVENASFACLREISFRSLALVAGTARSDPRVRDALGHAMTSSFASSSSTAPSSSGMTAMIESVRDAAACMQAAARMTPSSTTPGLQEKSTKIPRVDYFLVLDRQAWRALRASVKELLFGGMLADPDSRMYLGKSALFPALVLLKAPKKRKEMADGFFF
jgi:hypothetical protein